MKLKKTKSIRKKSTETKDRSNQRAHCGNEKRNQKQENTENSTRH